MRLYAGMACVLLVSATMFADEHEKKSEPVPNRGPASERVETGLNARTGTESVLDELQGSLDELYDVTGKRIKPSATGEVSRSTATFLSFPK